MDFNGYRRHTSLDQAAATAAKPAASSKKRMLVGDKGMCCGQLSCSCRWIVQEFVGGCYLMHTTTMEVGALEARIQVRTGFRVS